MADEKGFGREVPINENNSEQIGVNQSEIDYLRSIDSTLKQMLKNGASQNSVRDKVEEMRTFRQMYSNRTGTSSTYSRTRDTAGTFKEGFGKAMSDALLGSDFKKKMAQNLSEFADSVGVEMKDLPNQFGKELGDKLGQAIKNSKLGSKLTSHFDKMFSDVEKAVKSKSSSFSGFGEEGGSATGAAASKMFANAKGAASAAEGGTLAAAGAAGKALLTKSNIGLLVGSVALDVITDAFAPALDAVQDLIGSLASAAFKDEEMASKRAENARKRLEADVNTMVKYPFEILSRAADELYAAWDSNIRKINQTQGYNKEDLQDLIGSFASRLRSEGLTSVVSSADITNSLAQVLESGLSGKIAEEFAYQASVLNAAIPTQDFFSYASTYASIAGNMISQGKSEQEAMAYATSQLKEFANNILYASRQLSGGFSTGLKNAESLFSSAAQIANVSGIGNASQIGGTLASISAVVGSVAPELVNSVTDAVVNAAIGGNSSQIVALRSLAGINASNTEFLQAFARDPQSIFTKIFENLGSLQNRYGDAYLERAEALANTFGISFEALSQVDFNYLAKSIANMNTNSNTLEENLSLLKSGESTTSAEQLKMQQINKYMLEEGLSYVLDNEAARAIQQHMWDEQIANELMAATYAVEIKGDMLTAITELKNSVSKIFKILTPWGWGQAAASTLSTMQEAKQIDDRVAQLLEAGKVGSGNAQALHNLTTRGEKLNLTPDIITLMGGTQSSAISVIGGVVDSILGTQTSGLISHLNTLTSLSQAAQAVMNGASDAAASMGPSSRYTWRSVGKSVASAAFSSGMTGSVYSTNRASYDPDAINRKVLDNALRRMTDSEYIKKFVEEGKGYNEWAATASKFGISNLKDALEQTGRDETELKEIFQDAQAQDTVVRELERMSREDAFWANMQEYTLQLIELAKINNEFLENILDSFAEFKVWWSDYFIKHTVYSASYSHADVSRIQSKEKTGEQTAIYALADALTQNTVDLRDPTIQTNAILAQILLVVKAIMQQNNTTGKLTIPDALAAMASGLMDTSK